MRGWTVPTWLATASIALVLAGAAACAAREETTPFGYVIAPSVPADAGASIDASR